MTPPRPDARRPFVLVVDDVAMFRELESLFLARLARVAAAGSAAEARAALRAERPDVVVLDWSLRDAAAEEVVGALRRLEGGARTRIVAVTTGRAREHARAVQAGASDVVTKPLSRRVLVEAVRGQLEAQVEPRALPRVPVETPVRLWNRERSAWGLARNLSRGGMFIECEWLPPTASELHLAFRLGEPPTALAPSARLVWRRRAGEGPPGMGVRFLGVDGETFRRLDDYVHEHLHDAAGAAASATRP